MRHRTAQYPRMGHAGQLNVARVDRFAADLFDGIDAMRIGADDFQILHGLHDRSVKMKKATMIKSPWPATEVICGFSGCLFRGSICRSKGNENSYRSRAYAGLQRILSY